jgi:hypothetical protein
MQASARDRAVMVRAGTRGRRIAFPFVRFGSSVLVHDLDEQVVESRSCGLADLLFDALDSAVLTAR